MDNDERLEGYLELCRRIYQRMCRDGSWPWPGPPEDTKPKARIESRSLPVHHRVASSSIAKMSKPRNHASLEGDPVLPFDNSSSGSKPAIELMTVADAAAFLRISRSGVRRLQQGRHLPFVKIGGSVRFAKRDLVTYLAQKRVEALDP
jgi:excisionase family DNA binding protein